MKNIYRVYIINGIETFLIVAESFAEAENIFKKWNEHHAFSCDIDKIQILHEAVIEKEST